MQAVLQEKGTVLYHGGMNTGRPAKRKRTPFGARLHALREVAGLSQREVAARLDITQPAYALWERRNVSVRIVDLYRLADILGVGVEDLFYDEKKTSRRGGPIGKARQTFEAVSTMPRTQQKKILDVVDALVAQAKVPQ